MELFWRWALVGGATPDNFLGAYHHVADELIYRDSQKLRRRFLDALMKAGDTADFVSSKVVTQQLGPKFVSKALQRLSVIRRWRG